MTADQYVESVLAKYEVARGPASPAERLGAVVAGLYGTCRDVASLCGPKIRCNSWVYETAPDCTGPHKTTYYFPMQKLAKIRPSRSSLDTSPVISPSAW
jgi:hypothetical protein